MTSDHSSEIGCSESITTTTVPAKRRCERRTECRYHRSCCFADVKETRVTFTSTMLASRCRVARDRVAIDGLSHHWPGKQHSGKRDSQQFRSPPPVHALVFPESSR